VIENRGGASGNIGTAVVAQSAPDGYSLLVTSSSPIVINPSLYKTMPFNPQKDLAPITNVLRVPLVLAVNIISESDLSHSREMLDLVFAIDRGEVRQAA
jgi:tripartite-type tricarboxylate transporter receptor subunit TctC